jgi:hypothetical protein
MPKMIRFGCNPELDALYFVRIVRKDGRIFDGFPVPKIPAMKILLMFAEAKAERIPCWMVTIDEEAVVEISAREILEIKLVRKSVSYARENFSSYE